MCKDNLDWMVFFHAMILIGAVPVIIQPTADKNYVDCVCSHVDLDHWFTPIEYDSSCLFDDFYDYTDQDDWAILTSSGTTANPKLIVHHQNGLMHTFMCDNPFGVGLEDRILCGLSFSTSFGMIIGILGALSRGYTTVAFDVEHDARDLYGFFCEHAITHAMISPRLVEFMNRHWDHLPRTLREVHSTGEVLTNQVSNDYQAKFAMPVFDNYGFGECRAWSIIQNTAQHRRQGSLGLVSPGIEYQLRDDKDRPVAVNQIGELCIRHPNLARGYLGDSIKTQNQFQDGWFRTGDYMSQDSDGYLFYAGRREQLMLSSSGWISCIEMENRLCQNAGIHDCVVIKESDQFHAFILGKHPDPQDLTKHLSSVKIVTHIPYTSSNKKIRQLRVLNNYVLES